MALTPAFLNEALGNLQRFREDPASVGLDNTQTVQSRPKSNRLLGALAGFAVGFGQGGQRRSVSAPSLRRAPQVMGARGLTTGGVATHFDALQRRR